MRRLAVVLGMLLFVAVFGAAPAHAVTAVYNYTGDEQVFTVPAGVTSVQVVAIAGKGGSSPTALGGFGARVTGTISVTPGEVLYIEIGGNGDDANDCCSPAFNGGGAGGQGAPTGAAGGGATDVRRLPRGAGATLGSRLIIAAGGGGAGTAGGGPANGAGGTCPGCSPSGGSGTANAGGSGGAGAEAGTSGSQVSGGPGGSSLLSAGGGGGGGGLYGGGGGGGGGLGTGSGGGGGGSNLVPAGGGQGVDNDGVPSVTLTYTPAASYPLPPPGTGTRPVTTRPAPPGTADTSPRLLSPFPIVRVAGRVTRRGTRIRLLSVRAPRGTRIQVRCRGSRCPRRQTKRGRGMNRSVRFRRFERGLRPGVRLEVRVTRAGTIGKVTRIRIRRNRAPRRGDLCLRPGARIATACPDE